VLAAVAIIVVFFGLPLAVSTRSGTVLFSVAATANAEPDCSPSARADSILDMVHFVETHPEIQKMLGDAWRQSTEQERRAAIEAYLARHPDEGSCGP
jgi:hypothetical protein